MKNIFKIKQRYLIFRDQVKPLRNWLLKEMKKNSEIYLDFSKVDFISRSFADELLNLCKEFEQKRKKIRFLNQSLVVKKLLNIVKNTKKRIKKEVLLYSK